MTTAKMRSPTAGRASLIIKLTNNISNNRLRSLSLEVDDHGLSGLSFDSLSLNTVIQAHGILSQLWICRESLMALQSQSQELHQRMTDLTAIAQQMEKLQTSEITESVPGSEVAK